MTKKNPIKTYHNSRGEGKLFSVDLADESGEMRATGFNQECDKYYDFLKEGAVRCKNLIQFSISLICIFIAGVLYQGRFHKVG